MPNHDATRFGAMCRSKPHQKIQVTAMEGTTETNHSLFDFPEAAGDNEFLQWRR
jgi:hypothetical protein